MRLVALWQTVGIMLVFFILGIFSEVLKSMPDCPWLAFAHAGSDNVVDRSEWDLFTGQVPSSNACRHRHTTIARPLHVHARANARACAR
jgi:hypothetical protein